MNDCANANEGPVSESLWTVKDVASYLRRSVRWVYGHADRLPGVTRDFGGLRFNPAAIRAHVENGAYVQGFPRSR